MEQNQRLCINIILPTAVYKKYTNPKTKTKGSKTKIKLHAMHRTLRRFSKSTGVSSSLQVQTMYIYPMFWYYRSASSAALVPIDGIN